VEREHLWEVSEKSLQIFVFFGEKFDFLNGNGSWILFCKSYKDARIVFNWRRKYVLMNLDHRELVQSTRPSIHVSWQTYNDDKALSLYGDDDDDVITSGPFANLMRPHEMQPIYLLPLTNGVKQLLTFCVFGFDFKTDFKKGSAMKKLAGFFVAYLAKLVFIFLAFNSYVSDFRKFQSREARNAVGGIREKIACFFLLPKKKILRKSEIQDSFR